MIYLFIYLIFCIFDFFSILKRLFSTIFIKIDMHNGG